MSTKVTSPGARFVARGGAKETPSTMVPSSGGVISLPELSPLAGARRPEGPPTAAPSGLPCLGFGSSIRLLPIYLTHNYCALGGEKPLLSLRKYIPGGVRSDAPVSNVTYSQPPLRRPGSRAKRAVAQLHSLLDEYSALPCLALPCLALPCLALPCLDAPASLDSSSLSHRLLRGELPKCQDSCSGCCRAKRVSSTFSANNRKTLWSEPKRCSRCCRTTPGCPSKCRLSKPSSIRATKSPTAF